MRNKNHPSMQHSLAVGQQCVNDIAAIEARLDAIEAKTDLITVTGATNLDNIRTEVDALPVGLSGYESRISDLEGEKHVVAFAAFDPKTSPTYAVDYNFDTITRVSAGAYRLTFDSGLGLAADQYVVVTGFSDAQAKDFAVNVVDQTATYIDLGIYDIPSNGLNDNCEMVSVAIWKV